MIGVVNSAGASWTRPLGACAAFGDDVPGQADLWGLEKESEATPLGESAPPRIFVVDDEEELHLFLRDLGNLGHFRLTASCYNAAQALERVPEDRPDAVIMDIRLP